MAPKLQVAVWDIRDIVSQLSACSMQYVTIANNRISCFILAVTMVMMHIVLYNWIRLAHARDLDAQSPQSLSFVIDCTRRTWYNGNANPVWNDADIVSVAQYPRKSFPWAPLISGRLSKKGHPHHLLIKEKPQSWTKPQRHVLKASVVVVMCSRRAALQFSGIISPFVIVTEQSIIHFHNLNVSFLFYNKTSAM